MLITAMLILAAANVGLDRVETGVQTPFSVTGRGVINNGTHPKHPGDLQPIDAVLRMTIDPVAGDGLIEVETGEGDSKDVDRYFVRRGRVFQTDDKGAEIAASPLADVSAAAMAVFHPALVAGAMRATRTNVRAERDGTFLFAANDELWTVLVDASSGGRIVSVKRKDFSEVYGDGDEEVSFGVEPARVTVRRGGRETARFALGGIVTSEWPALPAGDEKRDRGHAITPKDIALTELAPHLFAIDLAPLNTRVTVAEFKDYVAVFEGAYSAAVGDMLVRVIKEKLHKPVRYFAFSHLHGQYIGSTRSFVAEGTTILVPPTTAPMIEQIATSLHTLQPDGLSRAPKRAKIEPVKKSRLIQDEMNAVEIHNVVSEHTDEYFIFWFPGPKILLTGDLLFYRPGKPLSGRSLRLCRTLKELSLEPERFVATWPLDGFGTKNIVSAEELRPACEAGP